MIGDKLLYYQLQEKLTGYNFFPIHAILQYMVSDQTLATGVNTNKGEGKDSGINRSQRPHSIPFIVMYFILFSVLMGQSVTLSI